MEQRRTPPWWRRLRSRRVHVVDESMVPALRPGDRLLVDPAAYRSTPPGVGDIVVFVDPEQAGRWLIKRVAAVGPGRFWRTGAGLDPTPSLEAVESFTLPASVVFVLGDGPSARDSRRFGPIPFDRIVGRAYFRYAPPERRGDV